MLRKLRSRLTYANVVATMALFVAVGTGGAYAANTVFSADIVDGEVKSIDIGQNEIGSADVKDNSINTFDVHSFLGVDVVDESLTGFDIQDNSLEGGDIGANSIDSDELVDATLDDEDIGQTVLVDFTGTIGVVPANSCVSRPVGGLSPVVGGDHLLLTPNLTDAATGLIYAGEYAPTNGTFFHIKACNPTTSAIDDGNTHFSALLFDAQDPPE
jgi:hypothetical protein